MKHTASCRYPETRWAFGEQALKWGRSSARHIAVACGSYWQLRSTSFGDLGVIFRWFFWSYNSALVKGTDMGLGFCSGDQELCRHIVDSVSPSMSAFKLLCESRCWTQHAVTSTTLNQPTVQHCHCLVTNAYNFDFTQCSAIHLAPQFEKGLPFVSPYRYYLTLSYELLMTQR